MSRRGLDPRVNYAVVATALIVTAADALTKAWARHALAAHDVHVGGPLWLRLEFNQGVSFSFGRFGALTTIVTIVVALVVGAISMRARPGVPSVGFGLLIGGGVANVIDRLAASPHVVTDFVAVGSFPVFNLADAAITVGFIVLVVAVLSGKRLIR
ncbi:MAG: signal peptidase II [Acidimicrobiales bacterium]